MASDDAWRALFLNWPDNISKEGITTTSLGEIVTCIGYRCAQLSLRLRQLNPINVPCFPTAGSSDASGYQIRFRSHLST